MAEQYSIRELAQEFNVTTRTLRFYEEKGLLAPARHKQSRRYNGADRARLKLILRGKRVGFTLDESCDIIKLYDPTSGNKKQFRSLIRKVQEKRNLLLRQQEDLELMLSDLAGIEQRCINALEK